MSLSRGHPAEGPFSGRTGAFPGGADDASESFANGYCNMGSDRFDDRRRGVCSSDAIADASDSFDHVWVAEFAAQPANGDLNGLGERVGVLIPDPFEEVFSAQGGG